MTLIQERPTAHPAEGTVVGHALPQGRRSARLARAIVQDALSGLPRSTVDTAQLLVSELVTNAVVHARSMVVLHVSFAEDRLRIGVEDLSSDYPLPQEPPAQAESGLGLMLVGGLAKAWGWDRTPVGKHVWCELPVDPAALRGSAARRGSARTD